jgi:hypothetical protein
MAGQRLMQSFPADPAHSRQQKQIHPVLTSFADEVCATVARLFAYLGTLALITILAVHGWDQLQIMLADEPLPGASWSEGTRSHRTFALSQLDTSEKSETYTILRHPLGGRKDILRWTGADGKAAAELEIYRLGGEFEEAPAATTDLAIRMNETGPLEGAGIIDSKLGLVTLFRRTGAKEAGSCAGFMRRIDDPALQISGFSCQGNTLPVRRAAISCMLNRLTLLASGNEPKLAELFARAELKRGSCGGAVASAASEDWTTGVENPLLRGTF